MNGSALGLDAGRGVGGAQRVDVRSPAWCVTIGRAAAGSSASAAGTRSLSAAAPRLPPTTSRRSGPVRPAKALLGGGMAAISSRTGLPTHSTLARVPTGERAGKPQQDAIGAVGEDAIGEPGDGVRIVDHQRLAAGHAHQRAGKDANPPMPSTTSGARGG